MRTIDRNCTTNISVGELGRSMLYAEAAIDYTYDPAEPATWDYPGDAERGEVDSVKVLSLCGSDWEFQRSERPDWFAYADACLLRKLESLDVVRFISENER